MSDEQPINQTDELIEEFIADCEREAAKLEITVDYYLAEFVDKLGIFLYNSIV